MIVPVFAFDMLPADLSCAPNLLHFQRRRKPLLELPKMMGFDTIIGLTGLALTLPGLVQTTIHFSRHLAKRCDSIPDLDESSKVRDLILSLQCGTLRATMESVEDLYADTSDAGTRYALQGIVERVSEKMKSLDREITQITTACGDEKQLNKARTSAHHCIDGIETMAEKLRAHVQVRTSSRPLPSHLQLRNSQFSLVEGSIKQLPHAPVQMCLGEFRVDQGVTESLCIVEDKVLDGLLECDALDTILELSRSLQFRFTGKGILQLAGFQAVSASHFRLVFPFPAKRANPRSLRDILLDPINSPVPPIPRNYRFILPRKLAEAVYHVHEQNLVHKCIRPESILLFEPEENGPDMKYPRTIGLPVLTDWQHARKTTDVSKRQPFGDWTMAMYQHPERQAHPSTIAASRYHIGHDIYSLGICLLEIGLWHPLIIYGGAPAYSPLLVEAKAAWRAENAVIHPNGQPLTDAEIEQRVFIHLAGDRLAFEMGEAYSKLVVKCLTCLERGFGNVHHFVDSTSRDWQEQGFLFIQEIRRELAGASTMGEGIYNMIS